jgi:hypothetical protein
MSRRIAALLALLVVAPFARADAQVALTPEQQQGLDDARQLVREYLRIYKPLYAVDVEPAAWVGAPDLTQMAGVGAVYNRALSKIHVNPRILTSPHREVILAVSLASELVRRPSQATRLADYEREQRERRLDATAKGVEVLARTRGLSEAVALERVYALLTAVHRAQTAPGAARRPPPLGACEQIRDLAARFPQHPSPSVSDCAP